jgi:hypothetical protein
MFLDFWGERASLAQAPNSFEGALMGLLPRGVVGPADEYPNNTG